jgi:very-short-patch-repair endonuclease
MLGWGIDLDMDGQPPNRDRAEGDRGVCGKRIGNPPDSAIAELASRQRGVVTRAQLLAVGLTRNAIDGRLKAGRLHALYRGAYLVGHAVPLPGARELGAVLVCGPGAVISHRTAAALWRLVPNRSGDCDVTVPGRDCRRTDGIRAHRVARLVRRDVRELDGIPITTPARTIVDLAAVALPRELEQALAEAQARRLVGRSELLSLLALVGRRPGAPALRSLLEADNRPALTRSEAEERLLALIRAAQLPAPELNVRIGSHEVDFLWREQALIVEVDGFRFHSSLAAFERDRVRDSELVAGGFRVIRVTWRQIVDQTEAVIARIAVALAP